MKKILYLSVLMIFLLPINIKAATYYTSAYTPGVYSFNKKIASVSVAGNVTATFSNPNTAIGGARPTVAFRYSGNQCGSTTYSISFTDGTSTSGTLVYKQDWSGPKTGTYKVTEGYPKRGNNASNYAYDASSCTLDYTDTNGKKHYVCTKKWERCGGGGGSEPTTTQETINGCFANKNVNDNTTLYSKASVTITKVNGVETSRVYSSSVYRYKVDDSYCNAPEVICSNLKQPRVVNKTTYCEGHDEKFRVEEVLCEDYYKIESATDYVVNYDMNKDNQVASVLDLKIGESFTFAVKINEKSNVKGTFFVDKWLYDYHELEKKYIENAGNARETFYVLNEMEKLENIVSYYNDYYVNKKFLDEQEDLITDLEFNYKVNGKNMNQLVNFEKNIYKSQDGSYTGSNTVVLSYTSPYVSRGGITMINFDYNNYSNERISYYLPPMTILDTKSGENQSVLYQVNGYNRIYTNARKIDVGVYDVIITTKNLGVLGMNDSEIVNEICDLNYQNEDLIFRVIDVSNPFINNTYKVGTNWLNGTYDFRNIIKSDIWLSDPYNSIALPNELINYLHRDNNSEKYLGTCDTPTANSSICNLIK